MPPSKNREILENKMTILMRALNFSTVVGLTSKEISQIIWRNAHLEAKILHLGTFIDGERKQHLPPRDAVIKCC